MLAVPIDAASQGSAQAGSDQVERLVGDGVRVAAFAAVASGETKDWDAIAVVIDDDKLPSPCGACRQVLAEFAPGLRVILATTGGLRKATTVGELLPDAFLPGSLPR